MPVITELAESIEEQRNVIVTYGYLNHLGSCQPIDQCPDVPENYDNIILITKGYLILSGMEFDKFDLKEDDYQDLFYAYDNDERDTGRLFIGQWNDGVL